MLQKLRGAWGRWRENSRQYKVDRALYKAGADKFSPKPTNTEPQRGPGPGRVPGAWTWTRADHLTVFPRRDVRPRRGPVAK